MNFNKMTKKQLEEHARTIGIELGRGKLKKDMIAELEKATTTKKKPAAKKKQTTKKKPVVEEDTAGCWKGFAIMAIVILFFLQQCQIIGPSDEEIKQEKSAQSESCISDSERQCKRACSYDRVGMYCSNTYGDNILGSGCTSEIKNLSYADGLAKCEKSCNSSSLRIGRIEACIK
jgi:hypothetical protein